jgi:hypothetical protein
MSVKDSLFVHYLDKKVKDSLVFTIQEKCTIIIDSAVINARFEQLNKERKNTFISYFKKREVEKQVNFSTAKNVIPYNGFSFYKIEYNGEIPESLFKAYQQMKDLNNESPRKQFQKERKSVTKKSQVSN